ncbi:BRD4-interacting chromatin-remodeling complex-associated protein isoform X2 [Scleropages formosus]|uniref:BRD4 interacting chromatin remodeling complex associated protein n=1 Tax=Scleropages formosus TaxID=113540 RepID=A0A8C9SM51_SCLFO|nr:BRD4-interacting chromatin-remodeling complex-associated protein-like isoform X2 [Scleropages formosus]
MGARAGLYWKPRAAWTSVVSVDMDDEDGRCLLDVICDPEALNDFLHGSETHGHVPEIQPAAQLSANEPPGLPTGSVDLDFLEDDDILGGSPGGGQVGGSNGFGTDHEPCDILQQSLAEANITEQSLQEAEAELGLSSFGLTGLTQVVQPLGDPSMTVAGDATASVGISLGVGGPAQIFTGPTSGSTAPPPPAATTDMLGSVLAHPGLQLQSQVMNKAIGVQPFVQQVGLGNMTLQPISSLQTLPNGSPSGNLGIGQIQVVGQPTVMTINQSGQPILAKTVGGYQLHQAGPELGGSSTQVGLGGQILTSTGGLLIQGGKAAMGSSALNGAAVGVSTASLNTNNGGSPMTSSGGLVGYSSTPVGVSLGTQQQTQAQGQIMQNVIIQRTPTPIQPKPPQGGTIQSKQFKQQQPSQSQVLPAPQTIQNEAKVVGVQQGPAPVSTAQNVAFLTGKAGANVVLSTPAGPQGASFSQAIFKPQTAQKPVSVQLLNQSGSIVIPSQTVLQGQNHQFLLPQLQAGGQILTQHAGGHIITSQGPGGQLIANQILATNQNLNLSQVLTTQGHPTHILSGPIQLQPGQMSHPTLFQMPVPLGQPQGQVQAHPTATHTQTVIQGMPIQNSLAMLGQMEGLTPTISLQAAPPGNGSTGGGAVIPCQPGEGVTIVSGGAEPGPHPVQTQAQAPVLTVQTAPSVSTSIVTPSSSPLVSSSSTSTLPAAVPAPPQAQHSPGGLFLTPQGSSVILSQESLQMFLQQDHQLQSEADPPPAGCMPASVIVSSAGPTPPVSDSVSAEGWPSQSPGHSLADAHVAARAHQLPSTGTQHQVKIQCASPSQALAAHAIPSSLSESPQPSQSSPLVLGQTIQSPHQQTQSCPSSQPPSRSCTPSSLPPLFIIHNQVGVSPQDATQTQPQPLPPQIQAQAAPVPQLAAFQQDTPPSSCSPKPPQVPPVQFQLVPPPVSASLDPGTSQQVPLQNLTAEQQQQTLQLIGAQLQAVPTISQPSPQQKQLLDKLHQVTPSIILQSKPPTQAQPIPIGQFNIKQEQPLTQPATSLDSHNRPAQMVPVLQQASVLASNDVKVILGPPGATPSSLTQSNQPKQSVIGSVGGLSLGKGGLRIQVCNTGVSQLPTALAHPPVQTQTVPSKRSLPMEPSKEARMLEQLRRQQGSVLHPDYASPFRSFEDALQRLLPYHLYQGTTSTPEDCHRVDDEFESVSSQLLKRTQAMIDKYRLLLFEESKRLGPSAEMVMIDRMFIQEEKVALNQDRLLAKERPEEYVAHSRSLESTATGVLPPPRTEPLPARASPATSGTLGTAATAFQAPTHLAPTKMVIKQGGGTASVTWSSSFTPGPAATRPSVEPSPRGSSLSSASSSSRTADDEDDLPQRCNRPPIKTYEARRRIGLKLKIKQEAGLSKIVHNTALDPIHTPTQLHPQQDIQPTPAQEHQQSKFTIPTSTSNARTPLPAGSAAPSSAVTIATTATNPGQCTTALSCTTPSLCSSSSSSQMNGTLEHHAADGAKQNPAATVVSRQITCRLPLRKTYRENISPRRCPGVPGGGDESGVMVRTSVPSPESHGSSPTAGRTVIASVKLEKRAGQGQSQAHQWPGPEHGPRVAGGAQEQDSSPRLIQELEEVEEVFYHGMMRNTHRRCSEDDKEGKDDRVSTGRSRAGTGKGGERDSRLSKRDRQGPGSSSLAQPPCPWDPLLPAKRRKSDSPDMDNASFSSGSPPQDDSLNEHLQSAIDSILNLQQSTTKGSSSRAPEAHPSQTHRLGAPPSGSHRQPVSSSPSPSMAPRSQLGGVAGCGQNGGLVSRTCSR